MSFVRLQQILTSPLYASLIAALVTLLALFIDHKINKIEDKTIDYVKTMLFVGALVYGVVWMVVGSFGGGGGKSISAMTKVSSILNEPF